MYGISIRRVKKALDLKREIVGMRFIPYQKEYISLPCPEMEGKATVCGMLQKAMLGEHFKVTKEQCACLYGAFATGLRHPAEVVSSGRSSQHSRLYKDIGVAKKVMEGLQYLSHKICGMEFGPLSDMEAADMVMTLATAQQAMYVAAGYANHFGIPQNISTLGNQGVCSDLISRPFTHASFNISMLCKGARIMTKADSGEVGLSIPANQFGQLADGILDVINPIYSSVQKKALCERLDTPDELGFEVDDSWNYSTEIRDYHKYVEDMGVPLEEEYEVL